MDVKKKKVIKAILMLVLIIIILLFWGGMTFAKHTKYVNSNGVTEVAKPVFVVDGADNIKIDGIKDTTYNFSVKNYNDVEISEVDLDYYIEIINDSEADLGFVLTKNGQSINLENNKSNLISLSSLTKQDDNYELQIKNKDNPAILSDIDGNVQIKVEAVQAE